MSFIPVATGKEKRERAEVFFSVVPEQAFHGRKSKHLEDTAEHLPEFGLRAEPAPQLAKDLAAPLLDLIDEKGQEHQQREYRRQVLLPVPVVVLEVIAPAILSLGI